MALSKTVKRFLSGIGRKGGSVKSAAKTAAVRLNAQKPRGRKKRSGAAEGEK